LDGFKRVLKKRRIEGEIKRVECFRKRVKEDGFGFG
jgi:hypothetical protein